MRLNLWPRLKINYPTEEKGQLFIPAINLLLFVGCCGIVLYFRNSSNMEAAYGLAITLCMIATSVLFANYLVLHRVNQIWIYIYLIVYLQWVIKISARFLLSCPFLYFLFFLIYLILIYIEACTHF
jgi:KUP system potassium uptake protein